MAETGVGEMKVFEKMRKTHFFKDSKTKPAGKNFHTLNTFLLVIFFR